MDKTIAIIPGDGIGPEIMAEAIKVLKEIESVFGHRFIYHYAVIGGAAWANFTVGAKGTAKVTVKNDDVNMGTGANSIFANGGTALMIHAKADDMKSDPAGNAGDRIACGTITK